MKKIVYLLPFSLLFIGCQDEEGVKQVELDLSNETSEESINKVVYTIPSPNEQFDLLQNIGGELDLLLIHDLESLDKYSSPKSISLNLGVYTADASYMMRYNQGKSVFMNYVSGLDRLATKLGVSQLFGEDLLLMIEEAEDNSELLYEISSDNYLKVYNKMVENDKSPELAMILAGGWIETMHILFNSAGEYNNDLLIQECITEQRYVLENLIDFMGEYKNNDDVNGVLDMLASVEQAYESLDCESTQVEVKKEEGNSMVLYGGDSCLFTADSYNSMKELINKLRNTITA